MHWPGNLNPTTDNAGFWGSEDWPNSPEEAQKIMQSS